MAHSLVPLALAAGRCEIAGLQNTPPTTPPFDPLGRPLDEPAFQRLSMIGIDGIVPIPLHPRRLAQRGFNQAGLLAVHLGRALGLPVLTDALARPKWTPSQRFLSARQRQDNVSLSFACRRQDLPARLLVVDDVFTTGATLNAAALILQEAGVARVHCVTLAKVIV
jgi:ComF family protein